MPAVAHKEECGISAALLGIKLAMALLAVFGTIIIAIFLPPLKTVANYLLVIAYFELVMLYGSPENFYFAELYLSKQANMQRSRNNILFKIDI